MRIRVENVYNTQSDNKSLTTLAKYANKHMVEIREQILNQDTNVQVDLLPPYKVDWTKQGRGEDIRFTFYIEKNGRGSITARQIYSICNDTCLSACYFTTN